MSTPNLVRALLMAFALVFASSTLFAQSRRVIALKSDWEFRPEGKGSWKKVDVPCSFEEHEGVTFDGWGEYRVRLPTLKVDLNQRVLLHFDGVGTEAKIFVNDELVGEHLGAWTPFRCDITRISAQGAQLRVWVDEKVGHGSQGFLPIIAPHFGGLWRPVSLIVVSEHSIDDLTCLAMGDTTTGCIRIEGLIEGAANSSQSLGLSVRSREFAKASADEFQWSEPAEYRLDKSGDRFAIAHSVGGWSFWSPNNPVLYEVELTLNRDDPGGSNSRLDGVYLDRVHLRAGFRSTVVRNDRLLLNGEPLVVRGLLNWGYAPPRVAPSLDEKFMRLEIEEAKAHGFNMMKFCLWVPPKRYLELADELGMLTWMEYPTWHSEWSKRRRDVLRSEFLEFFHYDRSHPSIVLRSLTCETGPSADIDVVRELYDLCHEVIPGSIVEDDSSWIQWNRVHDFYDDHPYGNNHTWIPTLQRLSNHIEEHGVKPLVLGEAIAADTWTDPDVYQEFVTDEIPFWLPKHFLANETWEKQRRAIDGDLGVDSLLGDSLRYGMLMRKFQVEVFRRLMPASGYVVSVIRDMPLASMGLLDYLGRPKWTHDAWSWHSNLAYLLRLGWGDHRFSVGEDQEFTCEGFLHQALSLDQTDVAVTERLLNSSSSVVATFESEALSPVTAGLVSLGEKSIRAPKVSRPERFEWQASIGDKIVNRMGIWVVPSSKRPNSVALSENLDLSKIPEDWRELETWSESSNADVVLTSRFDRKVVDYLEQGGRVLMIPDGEPGSLPTRDHWFLRGGPYLPSHPLVDILGRDLLLELQHFDLASSVIYDIDYLDQVSPIAMLWDNHDIAEVRTHGLLFEMGFGKGILLASSLEHSHSEAGRYTLSKIVDYLRTSKQPSRRLSQLLRQNIREKMSEQKTDLVHASWRFKPDPDNTGLENGWSTEHPDDTWSDIKIGTHWESQGHDGLDGWAWYQTLVHIPEDWAEDSLYLCIEGADDYYEIYLDGKFAGSGGDIESRTTAFEEQKSHDIAKFLATGASATLAFRVYDWYGAGGLFRPIWLSTAKISDIEIIR